MAYIDELEQRASLVREMNGECRADVFLDNILNERCNLKSDDFNLSFADIMIFQDEFRLNIDQPPTHETARLRQININSFSWRITKMIERTSPNSVSDLSDVLSKYQASARSK